MATSARAILARGLMINLLVTIFLSGDVMTGRGVDQILPHQVDPVLHERYVKSAERYVELARDRGARIDEPVPYEYIWGDALGILEQLAPDVRVINLETSVTTSNEPWAGKGIHYRMHPENVRCLTTAGIDCCVLANNHAVDWGLGGLVETIETIEQARIRIAGAGRTIDDATAPAVIEVRDEGRVLVFACGTPSSGIPRAWAATDRRPGLNVVTRLEEDAVQAIGRSVRRHARDGDVVILSIHWGGNWGYEIPDDHVAFAHRLIDEAGVDIIHGHSSHHVMGIEVYEERLILYGSGDLLNDYEGIGGHESYRPDLSLMYLPTVDPSTGALMELRLVPMRINSFRLESAGDHDTAWMCALLNRESGRFGVRARTADAGIISVDWRR